MISSPKGIPVLVSQTNQQLFQKLADRTVAALRNDKPRDNPNAKNTPVTPRHPTRN
jgi:hypothetical protein